MLLTTIAVGVTLIVLIVIGHPDPDNIPGDVMRSGVLAALALWIDWCTLQRWEKIAHDRRVAAAASQTEPSASGESPKRR